MVPVIRLVHIVIDRIPAFRPQAYEFDIYYRKVVVIFTDLAGIYVDDFTGHRDFTALFENFRVVKARLTSDEAPVSLVRIFRTH